MPPVPQLSTPRLGEELRSPACGEESRTLNGFDGDVIHFRGMTIVLLRNYPAFLFLFTSKLMLLPPKEFHRSYEEVR